MVPRQLQHKPQPGECARDPSFSRKLQQVIVHRDWKEAVTIPVIGIGMVIVKDLQDPLRPDPGPGMSLDHSPSSLPYRRTSIVGRIPHIENTPGPVAEKFRRT